MRRPAATFAAACFAMTLAAPGLASEYATLSPPDGTYAASIPVKSDLARARMALQNGDYSRAASLFAPLADGSLDPGIQLMAGFANLGAGDLARANIYFHRSMRRNASNPAALQGLGLVALARGDRDGAKAELAKLEQAAARCTGTCTRAAQIESAAASLRRAIG
ncbi:MAG: tetratricopeptide repeat protein [Novosphingobium sp.]